MVFCSPSFDMASVARRAGNIERAMTKMPGQKSFLEDSPELNHSRIAACTGAGRAAPAVCALYARTIAPASPDTSLAVLASEPSTRSWADAEAPVAMSRPKWGGRDRTGRAGAD